MLSWLGKVGRLIVVAAIKSTPTHGPAWRNGIRRGLKILRGAIPLRVRDPFAGIHVVSMRQQPIHDTPKASVCKGCG